jgi:hypothetical protein
VSRNDNPADALGFVGLLKAGYTPIQAWAEVRKTAEDPAVQAVIAEMRKDREGRAALEWSRQQWAGHGLNPPWEIEE